MKERKGKRNRKSKRKMGRKNRIVLFWFGGSIINDKISSKLNSKINSKLNSKFLKIPVGFPSRIFEILFLL